MSNILGVIPARYASSRFPGKPLVNIQGKSMIRRVYEQALKAKRLDDIGVATDDERIYEHVKGFGGKAWMTSKEHPSGTERIAEVAIKEHQYQYYINIQGDEPFLDPAQIDLLCDLLLAQKEAEIATLISPITSTEALFNPNVVKIVRDEKAYALYFSRSPIPFLRNIPDQKKWVKEHPYFKHLGIYGFSRDMLLEIPSLKPSPLEKGESLEQLRWLGHGYKIITGISEHQAVAVDTPEDLDKLPL